MLTLTLLTLGACQVQETGGPKQPKALPPEVFKPHTDIARVVMETEATPSDADGDGVVDGINVQCYLFPPHDDSLPVVGKGSFRFEVYDAADAAETRKPLGQFNINQEDVPRFQSFSRYQLVAYNFRVPLGRQTLLLRQVYLRARFFVEGGQEAIPAGAMVTMPGGRRRP